MKKNLLILSTAFLFIACTDSVPFISDSGSCGKQRTVCEPLADRNISYKECSTAYSEQYSINITKISKTKNSIDIDFVNKIPKSDMFFIRFAEYGDGFIKLADHDIQCKDYDCNKYTHLHCNYDIKELKSDLFKCNVNEEVFFSVANVENIKKVSMDFLYYIDDCSYYSDQIELIDFGN